MIKFFYLKTKDFIQFIQQIVDARQKASELEILRKVKKQNPRIALGRVNGNKEIDYFKKDDNFTEKDDIITKKEKLEENLNLLHEWMKEFIAKEFSSIFLNFNFCAYTPMRVYMYAVSWEKYFKILAQPLGVVNSIIFVQLRPYGLFLS
jgi:hypothetical protein